MKASIPLLALIGLSPSCAAERPAIPPALTIPVEPASPAPAAAAKGVWLGTLHVGTTALRIQLRLDPDAAAPGAPCTMDSIDQRGFGMACRFTRSAAGAAAIEVPGVKGSWAGEMTADASTLSGTWTQGPNALPLVLNRQAKAVEPPKEAMDPALPPVDMAGLKPVLDADLAAALARGGLAPSTGGGVVIGVIQHGARKVLAYGAAKPDSVFEIGSVSKTFTGLLLAQLVQQKKVTLDEPVRELLPPGAVAKPAEGGEVTLLDLSDQHSGLPRMPDNFKPADDANPYADYDDKALFAWLAKQGVARSPDAPFGYSNVGVGLLGAALARRAGLSYEALLRQEVTGPLGMRDTSVALTAAQKARFVAGHDGEHRPAHAWDFIALAGAGGVRSTANDMLTYLQAQLHPDKLPATAGASAAGRTLGAAITESHVVHAQTDEGMHIALNWFKRDLTGSYWHNGRTGGYTAFAAFNPARDYAVIVLSNTSSDDNFTDDLGKHVTQRLLGVAAVSLAPPVAP